MVDPNARLVIEGLSTLSLTLATAESLTAGLVASTLATVPGASQVLRGGVVAYQSDVKTRLLQVPCEVIAEHGVVSAPVAQAMAEGVRLACAADVAVSTTGVAGPGPCDGVAAGTAFVGVAWAQGTFVQELHCDGDRQQVRDQVTSAALAMVVTNLGLDQLRVDPGGMHAH